MTNTIRITDKVFTKQARGQSRKASMLEAFINVAIGYGIALLSQAVIFPLFDIHISTGQSMQIALAFTLVSIVRSYALRRMFNPLLTCAKECSE